MSFRIENKYLTSPESLTSVYEWLNNQGASVLHPLRKVNSIYFDSRDFASYFDTLEGSIPRKKIRIRCYGECTHLTGKHNLEKKISSIEGRFKSTSEQYSIGSFLTSGIFDSNYGLLKPIINISYQREYFEVSKTRITIDRNIKYSRISGPIIEQFKVEEAYFSLEVKSNDVQRAALIDSNFPFPKSSFSKYLRGVQALDLSSQPLF